jgi:hypothetical protein
VLSLTLLEGTPVAAILQRNSTFDRGIFQPAECTVQFAIDCGKFFFPPSSFVQSKDTLFGGGHFFSSSFFYEHSAQNQLL